jgi:predicted acylesterase/phospholipase RssA
MSLGEMSILKQPLSLPRTRRSRRCALTLAGGGVVGGMYEVGAVAAIEERLAGWWSGFDIYVGCSAGSVVASLLANGLRASELYQILDQDLPDPLNFRRGAVFSRGTFRRASVRLARLLWAVSKNVMHGVRRSIPDMLARAERDMPAGFFQLDALERFMRIHPPSEDRSVQRLQRVVRATPRTEPVGTRQEVISPILANVYLHYALDLWAEKVMRQQLRGEFYSAFAARGLSNDFSTSGVAC